MSQIRVLALVDVLGLLTGDEADVDSATPEIASLIAAGLLRNEGATPLVNGLPLLPVETPKLLPFSGVAVPTYDYTYVPAAVYAAQIAILNGQIAALAAGSGAAGIPVGSVALPSLSFAGDADTGIYHPAAETIGFATTGVERARIGATGDLSVGTTLDLARLGVVGGVASTAVLVVRGVAAQSANLQEWQDSSGAVLARISAAGNLYSTAFNTGTVGGNLSQFDTTNASGGYLALSTSGTDRGYVGMGANLFGGAALSDFGIRSQGNLIFAAPSERMRISSSSDVSIGTTADLARLGVVGSAVGTAVLVVRGAASQTANLQEWQDSTGTVLARVTPAGKLGIGTAGPSDFLHVYSTTNTYARIESSVGAAAALIYKNSNQQWYVGLGASTGYSNFEFYDQVAALIRMQVIAATGDVLIGTTGDLARLSVVGSVTTTPVAVVRGVASQSADLQQWQNSSNTVVASVGSTGGITALGLATSSYLVTPNVQDPSATGPSLTLGSAQIAAVNRTAVANVPFAVRGMAAQTGHLQDWQDSTSAVLSYVDSAGKHVAPAFTSPAGTAWTTFTPVCTSPSGWTLGNAVVTGRYSKVGNVVHLAMTITWGSTSTFSSAALLRFALPTGAGAASANAPISMAQGYIQTLSGYYYVVAPMFLLGEFYITIYGTNGVTSAISATFPTTVVAGDKLSISAVYEAA